MVNTSDFGSENLGSNPSASTFILVYCSILNECIGRNTYTLFLFKISYMLFKKEYKVGDVVTFFLRDGKEEFIATF